MSARRLTCRYCGRTQPTLAALLHGAVPDHADDCPQRRRPHRTNRQETTLMTEHAEGQDGEMLCCPCPHGIAHGTDPIYGWHPQITTPSPRVCDLCDQELGSVAVHR